MVGGDHQWRDSKHLRGSQGVNVIAAPKGVDQQPVARKMREKPKFDLRIISREQNATGISDEGRSNSAP
jgi:hypothetical protein